MSEEEMFQALEKGEAKVGKALESRIRMLMRKYVCYQHCDMKKGKPCVFYVNGDEHLCDYSGFEMNIFKEVEAIND